MTLAGMLSRRAIIRRRGPGVEDGHGNREPAVTTTLEVACSLEQIEPLELLVGRETYISTARAAFLGGTPLDGNDEVEIDGVVYAVIGDPNRGHFPSSGEVVVEANLRAVR